MVYHMLWLVRIHTKPEYPFPAETSCTFPEIDAASAGRKVKSHIAKLWDFCFNIDPPMESFPFMHDSVSLIFSLSVDHFHD